MERGGRGEERERREADFEQIRHEIQGAAKLEEAQGKHRIQRKMSKPSKGDSETKQKTHTESV
jgi:hypothetical protein